MRVSECVCVCVRERACVCLSVCLCLCVCMCVCVCVCVHASVRAHVRACMRPGRAGGGRLSFAEGKRLCIKQQTSAVLNKHLLLF